MLILISYFNPHTREGCDLTGDVNWKQFGALRKTGMVVTPFTGVWIEMSIQDIRVDTEGSHPSRVCGLKSR